MAEGEGQQYLVGIEEGRGGREGLPVQRRITEIFDLGSSKRREGMRNLAGQGFYDELLAV
jgi:hypothetical protein